MDSAQLEGLLGDLESDRVERKASLSDPDRVCQAICAFANDLADRRSPGVIAVGVGDSGDPTGLPITDRLLQTLADMRSNGNIVPIPSMTVEKRTLRGRDVAVVIVQPSDAPPVRYRGVTWVRVGPRRAIASVEDERRLAEKRRARDLPFDLRPVPTASLDDLDLEIFNSQYLASAVAPDRLAANNRTVAHQLVALRFATPTDPPLPTVVGLLVVGRMPTQFLPGAYLQFLRLNGTELTDPIKSQAEVRAPLSELLRRTDEILKANVAVAAEIRAGPVEVQSPDVPIVALQQIVRNAIMHRTYESTNSPVRVTWFSDRVEVISPGGPFGIVTRENFGRPGLADYRNPHIAEAMKNLGYVQRFGVGIELARAELRKNGNSPPEFQVEASHVAATIRVRV